MNTSQLNFLSSVYMIVFAAGAYFTCTTFEKWGVRRGLLIGSFLNALGSILKVAPGLFFPSYASMMGPQVLNAFAQLFVLSTPPLIAAQYFEPHQRAFATAVASTSNNLGNAIALAVPPLIVREGYKREFILLFCLEMGYCVLVFFGIVFFVQPPNFSSPSRALLLQNNFMPAFNDGVNEEELVEVDCVEGNTNASLFQAENDIEVDRGHDCNKKEIFVHDSNLSTCNTLCKSCSCNNHEQSNVTKFSRHVAKQNNGSVNNSIKYTKQINMPCESTITPRKHREEENVEVWELHNNEEINNNQSKGHNEDCEQNNGFASCNLHTNCTNNKFVKPEEMSTKRNGNNNIVTLVNNMNESKCNLQESISKEIQIESSNGPTMLCSKKSNNGIIDHKYTTKAEQELNAEKKMYNDNGSESKRKKLSLWRQCLMNAHVIQFLEVGNVVAQLMRRRDFIFLLLAFSISMGSVWTFASVLAQILEPFGVSATAAGLAGALNVVVGTVAAYLVGLWVDQSHRFKWPLVICLAGSIACCIGLMCLLWRAAPFTNMLTYVSCTIYIIAGIFQNTAVPICFEFAMEITYPLAESVPGALLMAGANVIGLILLSAASVMLGDGEASRTSCLHVLLLITCICGVGMILSILPREQLHRQNGIAHMQREASNAPEEQQLPENG